MIEYRNATVFNSNCEAIVNTVNCVGIMGTGLALEFSLRYPNMLKQYKKDCENKLVKIGKVNLYKDENQIILNFPTKFHWKYPSKIEWIEKGLDFIVQNYKSWNIRSIALPPLGCSNGGLNFDKDVKPLIEKKLSQLDILIAVCVDPGFPEGKEKEMLDFELAEIYGYETKNFNRQVKNNNDKFDEDFMFQLSKEEYKEILRCKNFTSSWGGTRHLPYAFTEQGIYMLMTVLKGELAVKQSKTLIRLFKNMKDYLIENNSLLTQKDYLNLFKLINNNSDRITELEEDIKSFSKLINNHYLILNGEKIEGDIAYQEIYRLANKTIYIIDDYIDVKTLQLLKSAKENIEIIILSDNKSRNNLNHNFINDFINDTGFNIQFKKNNNRFHDRYIIIDFDTENEIIFHCGASSKDAGKRITTITKIEEQYIYKELVKDILNNESLVL